MRKNMVRPWMLQLLLLGMAVLAAAFPVPEKPLPAVQSKEEAVPVQAEEPEHGELVGVWVPYMSLSVPEKTEEAFCRNFDEIAEKAAARGFNTLFVHVRPFGDALYPSACYPWSHILTGEQGKDPGYDPLAYMVEKAHAEGLQFHAWVNPLRISLGAVPPMLSSDNPYLAWQADEARCSMFLRCTGSLCYDPGYEEVRDHITAGITEIVENYDVDGVHFDDYFYPLNEPDADDESYAAYCAGVAEDAVALPREEWRQCNINALVSQVYAAVKRIRPQVKFGISPVGVVESNAYLSADVASWCTVSGYIDYICPQLYYSTEPYRVTFDEALAAWRALPRAENVALYIGLAVYKAGTDADEGAWQGKNTILAEEIRQGKEAGASGYVFYAWDQVESVEAAAEMEHAFAQLA